MLWKVVLKCQRALSFSVGRMSQILVQTILNAYTAEFVSYFLTQIDSGIGPEDDTRFNSGNVCN